MFIHGPTVAYTVQLLSVAASLRSRPAPTAKRRLSVPTSNHSYIHMCREHGTLRWKFTCSFAGDALTFAVKDRTGTDRSSRSTARLAHASKSGEMRAVAGGRLLRSE